MLRRNGPVVKSVESVLIPLDICHSLWSPAVDLARSEDRCILFPSFLYFIIVYLLVRCSWFNLQCMSMSRTCVVTERWEEAGGRSRSGTGRQTAPTLGRWVCRRTSVWYVVVIWNWCRSSSEPPVKSSTSARNCLPTGAGTVPPSWWHPTTSPTSLEVNDDIHRFLLPSQRPCLTALRTLDWDVNGSKNDLFTARFTVLVTRGLFLRIIQTFHDDTFWPDSGRECSYGLLRFDECTRYNIHQHLYMYSHGGSMGDR